MILQKNLWKEDVVLHPLDVWILDVVRILQMSLRSLEDKCLHSENGVLHPRFVVVAILEAPLIHDVARRLQKSHRSEDVVKEAPWILDVVMTLQMSPRSLEDRRLHRKNVVNEAPWILDVVRILQKDLRTENVVLHPRFIVVAPPEALLTHDVARILQMRPRSQNAVLHLQSAANEAPWIPDAVRILLPNHRSEDVAHHLRHAANEALPNPEDVVIRNPEIVMNPLKCGAAAESDNSLFVYIIPFLQNNK